MNQKAGPILYFIAGNVPTNEEFEKAQPLMGNGPIIQFISVNTLDLNGPLMEASAVAGVVPEPYKELPRADEVVKFIEDTIDLPRASKRGKGE